MAKTHLIRIVSVAGLAIASLGVLSGAAGAASGSVPRSVVESQTAKILSAETRQRLPHVKCPTDLPAKVGASIKCMLTPKGSKLKYPAVVTVKSVKNGIAYFHVQVGQAIGQANKTKFCADTAILDKATSVATIPHDLIPIFERNHKTLNDFQGTAPSDIVATAGTLVQAVRNAVNSGNAQAFTTAAIMNDIQKVSTYCGLSIDGTPAGG